MYTTLYCIWNNSFLYAVTTTLHSPWVFTWVLTLSPSFRKLWNRENIVIGALIRYGFWAMGCICQCSSWVIIWTTFLLQRTIITIKSLVFVYSLSDLINVSAIWRYKSHESIVINLYIYVCVGQKRSSNYILSTTTDKIATVRPAEDSAPSQININVIITRNQGYVKGVFNSVGQQIGKGQRGRDTSKHTQKYTQGTNTRWTGKRTTSSFEHN